MQVSKEKPSNEIGKLFSALKVGKLAVTKQQIMENGPLKIITAFYPSDKLFFESFDKFSPVSWSFCGRIIRTGLHKENLSYIERN
jgi:adenosine deaminase/adenosine deaminase CECR1